MTRARNYWWLIVLAGSSLLACGCSPPGVVLYELGDETRRGRNPASAGIDKAWELYGKGECDAALVLAERLLDDRTSSLQATELVAVIRTKMGTTSDSYQARRLLEDAIETNPHISWLRKAYIWHLTTEGYYAEAERESLRATEECNDLELWDWHLAVGKSKWNRSVKFGFLLLLGIGCATAYRSWDSWNLDHVCGVLKLFGAWLCVVLVLSCWMWIPMLLCSVVWVMACG